MSTTTFDTFKFVDKLEKAGLSREQASAIVEAQKDALSEALDSNIATRGDLAAVKAELKADIAGSKSDLKAEIAAIRSDMQALEMRLTIKLGALMVVAVGVIATLMKH
ncbi:MAG: DUF1640 domain-containing protein [Rhodoferax sp.]|nr:DUF1640 domain-containing protein [Rhodoferax sp.]